MRDYEAIRELLDAPEGDHNEFKEAKYRFDFGEALKYCCAMANGVKGTPLKELQQVLPSHSRKQIQLLLNELRDEEKIKLEGKTNGAKWFLLQ